MITSLELRRAIRAKYAWPGGYPMYCVTADGAALCMACARKEYEQIARARKDGDTSGGWHVDAVAINYEDASLHCDHCSERIESAYAEDQIDKGTPDDAIELWLCDDCTIAECNGDYSGMDDETATRVEQALDKLHKEASRVLPNFNSEHGHGIDEFKADRCDCCNALPGARHRFAVYKQEDAAC